MAAGGPAMSPPTGTATARASTAMRTAAHLGWCQVGRRDNVRARPGSAALRCASISDKRRCSTSSSTTCLHPGHVDYPWGLPLAVARTRADRAEILGSSPRHLPFAALPAMTSTRPLRLPDCCRAAVGSADAPRVRRLRPGTRRGHRRRDNSRTTPASTSPPSPPAPCPEPLRAATAAASTPAPGRSPTRSPASATGSSADRSALEVGAGPGEPIPAGRLSPSTVADQAKGVTSRVNLVGAVSGRNKAKSATSSTAEP